MCRKEAIHISNYQADTLYAMASPFLIKQLNESWNWRKYLSKCNVDGMRTLNFGELNNTPKLILVSPFRTIQLPNIAKKMDVMI
jgi:hypothetical protein